jgi:23S rRNA (adenine2503-C2)-methyltransferase
LNPQSDIEPLARLPEEWRAELTRMGEPRYRADQVFGWIHARGVTDASEMTNLPKRLRQRLATSGLSPALEVAHNHRSEDGTRKLVVRMQDGAAVETVLLPVKKRSRILDADAAVADLEDEDAEGETRVTQCISTQVGCAMGCVFCASGVAGLKRQMTPAEIVSQVLAARALLEPGEAIRNVVFMGMGEPLHNYEATERVIRLLSHPEGLNLSPRRITVSTSGLVPEIDRLGEAFDGRVSLAISLHQADDAARSRLMPINKKHPLSELMGALRRYPLRRGRRITIEYTLVEGQNDDTADAERLVKLLAGLPVKVNVIPMNPIAHSELGPPQDDRVLRFQDRLKKGGLLCFVRRRRGDDVAAACGQLALEGAGPNASFTRRQPR